MATMGKYCKAYSLLQLREFSQWNEQIKTVRTEKQEIDGKEVEVERNLTDNDFIYLQENFVVTDGIYKDEDIIFDDVTPEWKNFCTTKLGFEIPIYQDV